MVIDWEYVKEIAKRGVKIPHTIQVLSDESESLVEWGKENGFTESDCREAYWHIAKLETFKSYTEFFVRIRMHMMKTKRPLA